MLKQFLADMHIHTCLSPCAEIDMTPREIVRISIARGLHLIAVTDHNSVENIEATQRAASGTGLAVFGGMEVTSSEEVHILALFEDATPAIQLQALVYEHLPSGMNDERLYGHQVIVDERDEVTGFNKRLLIAATQLSARALLGIIRSYGGIAIASHIDREAFSVVSQLGFIPPDLEFDALEFSARAERGAMELQFKDLRHLPWVSFSDAHHTDDIGRRVTTFTIYEPTFQELKHALEGYEGRTLSWS